MKMQNKQNIFAHAAKILSADEPIEKCALTKEIFENQKYIDFLPPSSIDILDYPATPPRPEICPPANVPRRKITSHPEGRIALLHALAHIELNAINLAWDIILRFYHENLPEEFYIDWLSVANDEAKHFMMLDARLKILGGEYGCLKAHDGLWQAALDTKDNLLARLAVVPMVLEARGLDVTPSMINKLTSVNDDESATILKIIHDEEIRHVEIGHKWFTHLCDRQNISAKTHWHFLVKKYFKGQIKPPFNVKSRSQANFPESWYKELV